MWHWLASRSQLLRRVGPMFAGKGVYVWWIHVTMVGAFHMTVENDCHNEPSLLVCKREPSETITQDSKLYQDAQALAKLFILISFIDSGPFVRWQRRLPYEIKVNLSDANSDARPKHPIREVADGKTATTSLMGRLITAKLRCII